MLILVVIIASFTILGLMLYAITRGHRYRYERKPGKRRNRKFWAIVNHPASKLSDLHHRGFGG
jgi:hypothetical protein